MTAEPMNPDRLAEIRLYNEIAITNYEAEKEMAPRAVYDRADLLAEVDRLNGVVQFLGGELQREGLDVTEVLAENQRMREALFQVFAELLPEGRIGRTLLHGSYPTAANVGRHECLDAISAVLPQTAPATMPESAPAESSSPTEEKE